MLPMRSRKGLMLEASSNMVRGYKYTMWRLKTNRLQEPTSLCGALRMHWRLLSRVAITRIGAT